jgi:hypothetical protein
MASPATRLRSGWEYMSPGSAAAWRVVRGADSDGATFGKDAYPAYASTFGKDAYPAYASLSP